MDNIVVTVIITTYRRSQDIERALNSVLNQTFNSFEVFVVDDNGLGTPEGEKTAEIMKRYKDDTRLTYIRHDVNKNGAVARNTAIRKAKGKYISFLDDDDAYSPQRLEQLVDCMDGLSEEWGACYSGYVKHLPKYDQYSAERASGDVFVQTLMRSLYIGSGSNLFFRKSVVDEIGLFNESFRRNQDLEYLIRVLQKYKMAYVDKVLLEIFYDIRQQSSTREQWYKIEQDFYDKFRPYQEGLNRDDKKKVECMYALDALRYALILKDWKKVFSIVREKQIPLNVFIKYCGYIFNRWRTHTSYGFTF